MYAAGIFVNLGQVNLSRVNSKAWVKKLTVANGLHSRGIASNPLAAKAGKLFAKPLFKHGINAGIYAAVKVFPASGKDYNAKVVASAQFVRHGVGT